MFLMYFLIHFSSSYFLFYVPYFLNSNKFSYDYYKEIIGNYRRLIYELDFELVEEYAEQLPKTNLVMNTIQTEVF